MTKDQSNGGALARPVALALVGGMLGLAAILGVRNAPDASHPRTQRWYRKLDKPGFTPPDAAFGAVWPLLEAGLAVGGYRLMRQPASPRRNVAIGLWMVNVGMIGGWAELFFGRRQLGASVIASGAMVASGAGYAVAASKVDRSAAITALPFIAWLGFATLLAEEIWRRNRVAGGDEDAVHRLGQSAYERHT